MDEWQRPPPPRHWAKGRRSSAAGPKTTAPMTPRAAAHWSNGVRPDSGRRTGSPTCGRDGQGIPIPKGAVGQRPPKSGKRQAGRHVRIIVHEYLVVVSDELVANRLTKDETHGQQEKTADGPNPIGPRPKSGRPRRNRTCLTNVASDNCRWQSHGGFAGASPKDVR